MRWKIEAQQNKLDRLFELVRSQADEETQSHLTKLLCIRVSGFLEITFKNLLLEYLDGTSPREIQNFVNHSFKNFTNLKNEKFISTLSFFSQEWVEKYRSEINEELASSLNSLISNRNNIAHGENDNITFRSIEKYYSDTKEVIEILKKVVKKNKNRF